MAPLPSNTTMRIWIDYTSGGVAHSLMMRFTGAEPGLGPLIIRQTSIADALLNIMSISDSITGWRWSAPLSNVSLPYGGPVTGNGSLSGGVSTPESRAAFVGVSGRSGAGRRVTAHAFTIAADGFNVYRESVAALAANFEQFFNVITGDVNDGGEDTVAVDGLPIVWNNYLNIGQNAYWQRQSR